MMWRIKTLLFLLLAQCGWAAPGDIIGAWVETNGWLLRIRVDDMFTNGTYTFGFLTNEVPSGTNYCVLSSVSMGYDTNGNGVRVTNTLYGTTRVRHPWPDVVQYEDLTGDDLDLRIALNDYIYAADSNITLTISNAFYVTGSTSSAAAASIVVTNNSTNTYRRVIANNFWPPYEMTTSNTYRARVGAYHAYARNGRQVACIRFVATDTVTNITNFVISTTCDTNFGDAVPVEEYVWDVPASSFASSNLVAVNWTVYPWIGDSASIVDTMDGLYPTPSTNYCTNLFLNNYDGKYGQTWANVSTAGDDGTGVATTNTTWTTNTAPFASIGTAIHAIRASNNAWYGRADFGGGRVLCEAGEYAWPSNAVDFTQMPATYVIVTRMPHAARESVIVTNKNGTSVQPKKTKWEDISYYDYTTPADTFRAIQCLWLDRCSIASADAYPMYTATNWYVTRNVFHRFTQHLQDTGGAGPMSPGLIRGNWLNTTNHNLNVFISTTIGNRCTNNPGGNYTAFYNHYARHGQFDAAILANNVLVFSNSGAMAVALGRELRESPYVGGSAIVQNLFELVGDCVGGLNIGAETSCTNIYNVVIFQNEILGKTELFYNWEAVITNRLKEKLYIWAKNNIISDVNFKDDSTTPYGEVRVGNWAFGFGVGASGNHMPETFDVGGPGENLLRYPGIYSQAPASGSTTNTLQGFSNRLDYTVAPGPGNGNYHLTVNSGSLTNLAREWLLAYDLEGNTRSGTNAPGVYVYPTPVGAATTQAGRRYRFRWGF